jgi:hypothetical protein
MTHFFMARARKTQTSKMISKRFGVTLAELTARGRIHLRKKLPKELGAKRQI